MFILPKRVLHTAIPILLVLVLVALYLTRCVSLSAPAIVYIPQAPVESRITSALGAFVVGKFEVSSELPAGTTITLWLEYYEKGKRVDVMHGAPMDIPRAHIVTLQTPEKRMPIMLTAELVGDQQEWFLITSSSMQRFRIPYVREYIATGSIKEMNLQASLVYGEPIMLLYGISNHEGISQPEGIQDFSGERFSDEFIEYWLDNDDVFVFKVQIDLPGE